MNYYLARDGKTYGPYPQEYIPAMVQQGQLVPEDLLCPEGGSDWTPLSQLPALLTPASAPVAAPATATVGSKLRINTGSGGHTAAPAATGTPAPTYTPAPQRTGTMEKVGGWWRVLKLAGFAVVAVLVVGGLIAGFLASQRDKKEIAKLHSLPGWSAFDAANNKIDSESSTEGDGNTGEAAAMSKLLATVLEAGQKENFKFEKTTRYRGRSKLGRITSAVSSATAGTGHFQTFVELRKDRAVVLIHVPEFKRYKGEARKAMTEMCWEGALVMLTQMQKMDEVKALANSALTGTLAPGGIPTAPGTRPTPGGRAPPGRANAGRIPTNRAPVPASAPAPKAEPKFKRDLPLIVGVRGKDAYECVFVGDITNPEDSPPKPTMKNVPSHQLLVQWFGEEKPQ